MMWQAVATLVMICFVTAAVAITRGKKTTLVPSFERVPGTKAVWAIEFQWKMVPLRVFLINLQDSWVLSDTGPPEHKEKLFNALRHAQHTFMNGKRLSHVILTHAHLDHVGGLFRLFSSDLLTDAATELIIHEKELPYLFEKGHSTLASSSSNRTFRFLVKLGLFDELSAAERQELRGAIHKVQTVRDKENLFGSLIQVVGTPGHTPGHMSLLLTRERVLLAGDAIMALALWTRTPRLIFDFIFSTVDRKQARESAKQMINDLIQDKSCDVILPCHDHNSLGALTLATLASI